ncbi:MAG: STAS domain-containing protein [Rubripirellula sp.]
MARTRHRTFEIFDFVQEAGEALESKSARVNTYSLDPDLWRFHQLDVAIKPSGVVHVTFKESTDAERDLMKDLPKDLTDLADLLTNGSRILLDFEGLAAFDSDAVAKLTEFQGKLQSKGSRVVLCNLDSEVHASFFPHLKTDAKR